MAENSKDIRQDLDEQIATLQANGGDPWVLLACPVDVMKALNQRIKELEAECERLRRNSDLTLT